MTIDHSCGPRSLCVVCGIVLVLTATIFNSVSTSSSPVRTAIGLNAPVGTSRRSRGTGTRPVPPGTDVVWPSSAAYVTWRERQPFDQATKLGSPGTSSGGLTEGDRAVLAHWYFKAGSVFEIGLGESTGIAVSVGVPRLTGVDDSLERIGITSQEAPSHYRFSWADIGKLEGSQPADKGAQLKWPMYSFGALAAESEGFDFYFVGGRFRVASVAACFLHAARTGKQPDEFAVSIHDFKDRVRSYQDILSITEFVDGFNHPQPWSKNATDCMLVVLRRKKGATDAQFLAVWENAARDFDIAAVEPDSLTVTAGAPPIAADRGNASVRTVVWPSAAASVAVRERRLFDKAAAITELGFPEKSSGGLTEDDRAVLARWYFKADSVFEIGIGESTKIGTFVGVPRLTGVDSALEWIDIASEGAPAHYRFHFADLGKIGEWSQPEDKAAKPKWPMYSFSALAAESEGFDFYFVDGRFRVASAAACFLHAARTGKQPDEFAVSIHDFKDRVRSYRDILALTYIVDGFRLAQPWTQESTPDYNLVVLRRKQDATDEQFLALWEKYKFVKR